MQPPEPIELASSRQHDHAAGCLAEKPYRDREEAAELTWRRSLAVRYCDTLAANVAVYLATTS